MVRIDYTTGNTFPYSKWNVLANSINNVKSIYNYQLTYLNLLDPTMSLAVVVDTDIDIKDGSDVIAGDSAGINIIVSALNTEFTKIYTNWVNINGEHPTPDILTGNFTFADALDITETETLSWYDIVMEAGIKVMWINEQLKILDPTYVEPTEVGTTTTELTKISSNYNSLTGSIWKNDLTKLHTYSVNNYKQYDMPTGTLLVDITHPTLTPINVSFDTTDPWDSERIFGEAQYIQHDGTYLYVYNVGVVGVWYEQPDRDRNGKAWYTYRVSKIDSGGNIISETQYNTLIDTYSANYISSADIDYSAPQKNGLQVDSDRILHAMCFEYYEEEDNGEDRNRRFYFLNGVMTPTGWISTDITSKLNESWNDDLNDDEDFEYVPVLGASDGTTAVLGTCVAHEEYDDSSTDKSYVYMYMIKYTGGVKTYYTSSNTSQIKDRSGSNVYAITGVDNLTPAVYFTTDVWARDSISGTDPEWSEQRVIKMDSIGITTVDSISQYTALNRNNAYSGKVVPNYITNAADLYYVRSFYNTSTLITTYYYYRDGVAITQAEYNAAGTGLNCYSYLGDITTGFEIYGDTWEYSILGNQPLFYSYGLLGQHQSKTETRNLPQFDIKSGKLGGTVYKISNS